MSKFTRHFTKHILHLTCPWAFRYLFLPEATCKVRLDNAEEFGFTQVCWQAQKNKSLGIFQISVVLCLCKLHEPHKQRRVEFNLFIFLLTENGVASLCYSEEALLLSNLGQIHSGDRYESTGRDSEGLEAWEFSKAALKCPLSLQLFFPSPHPFLQMTVSPNSSSHDSWHQNSRLSKHPDSNLRSSIPTSFFFFFWDSLFLFIFKKCINFWLEDNCITIFCWFLPYNNIIPTFESTHWHPTAHVP